jgi:PAS domain S-box-containing protein
MAKIPVTEITHQKKEHSLSSTLLFWFLLLSLLPLSLTAWVSYQQAVSSLTTSATEQLTQDAQRNSRFIQNWFDYRFMDLKNQAENRDNAKLLTTLKKGFSESGQALFEFTKSLAWAQVIDEPQQNLINLYQSYDYIYDIFIIDNSGNILYTVTQGADQGQNLFSEPLAGSHFAHTVKESLQTGEMLFSDLGYYAPSDKITGFITAPISNKKGDKIGVFAIQLRLERINKLLQNKENAALHHYLIGEDNRLRTPIISESETVLVKQINTNQILLWQHEHGIGSQREKHPDNEVEPATQYTGPHGNWVIGVHKNIRLPGTNWAMVSEIEYRLALASANHIGIISLILFLLTATLVSAIALYQSRHITQPIIHLAKVAMNVAAGESDRKVTVEVNNEIGRLADAFNHMLVMRQVQEQAVEQSNKQTKEALENLAEQKFAIDQHAIVAITDVQGTITFTNDKFSEISGYSTEELLGQNHRMLNSGFHDKSFFHAMYKVITSGQVWHGKICNRAKNGHLYWVDTTIVPFMGAGNKPQNYIAIRTDITEQKMGELKLQEAMENAEAANSAKSEFLANMSHEIRTPMNGVIGMTTLLLDTPLNDDQTNQALSIKRSSESLLSIINDILDFSKIEAGKLNLELLAFDLDTMLADFAHSFSSRADEKDLLLICPANPINNHYYIGDSGRIRQVLTNLVGNAIKFTEQGEVVVRYESTKTADGHCKLHFTISDTGIGLTEAQQKTLFERFTQADGSTTRKFGGTGLGLSISKQLVEMMDGEIGVESKPGEGSIFWFTLILESAKEQLPARQYKPFENEKILILDNHPCTRQLLHETFSHWQIEHDMASDSSIALEILENAVATGLPYSTVLINFQMSEIRGLHLGEIIQQKSTLHNPHLILITDHQHDDSLTINKARFQHSISHPIQQSELYNTLLDVVAPHQKNIYKTSNNLTKSPEFSMFNARILVVEDNTTNQAVAKGMLEKFGLSIDIASNGQEAISALHQLPYDLVFMDCQMPVMDGFAATGQIRNPHSLVKDHAIPVIAMTANAMQGDRERCISAGMDDYIAKPIDPMKLNKALQQWLPKQCQKNTLTTTEKEQCHPIPTTAKTIAEPPIFDYMAMRERLMDDDDLIKSIAEAFLSDLPNDLKKLQAAVEKRDMEQAAAIAHKIKGSSGNVGGMLLSASALIIEQAGKANDLQVVYDELPKLEQCVEQLIQSLQEAIF